MANQLRKRIRLSRLKRFGFNDQIVVARAARSRDKIDADRRGGGVIVRRRELVDDRLHAIGRVLRRLGVLSGLRWDDIANGYSHNVVLKLTCS